MAAISDKVSTPPQSGDGTNKAFAFDFSIIAAGDVGVYVDGVEKDYPDDYGVVFGDMSGTVTFHEAPAAGTQILLVSQPDYSQTSEFANQSAYNLSTVNTINRRATIRDLVTEDKAIRALKVPLREGGLTVPSAANRAGKIFGFDGSGSPDLTRTFLAFDASVADTVANAGTALAQAGIATAQATIATTSASTAITQASIATTQASTATVAAAIVTANLTNINLVAANAADIIVLATDLNLGAGSAVQQASASLTQILALGLLNGATTTTAAALAGSSSGNFVSVRNADLTVTDLYYHAGTSLILSRTDVLSTELSTKIAIEKSASFVTQPPLAPDFSANPIDGKLYMQGAIIPNRSASRPAREQLSAVLELYSQRRGID